MKKMRIILIICIIVLTSSLIGLIIYAVRELSKKADEEYVMEKTVQEALEGYLYPNNFREFYFKYEGTVSSNDIYHKLYNIFEVGIPKLATDVNNLYSEEKIKAYYNDETYIKDVIGIDNEENFAKLVDMLKNLNNDTLKYSISEITPSSTKVYSNRTEFELSVSYENCENIKFKVIVYNRTNNNTFISIVPMEEE